MWAMLSRKSLFLYVVVLLQHEIGVGAGENGKRRFRLLCADLDLGGDGANRPMHCCKR
jgi:hypothetical protein